LAQRQQAYAKCFDLTFKLINLHIALHNLASQITVPSDQGACGIGNLAFHEATHARDHVAQLAQILIIAADDMFCGHLNAPAWLSQTGQ
jgi:hypothetical protein